MVQYVLLYFGKFPIRFLGISLSDLRYFYFTIYTRLDYLKTVRGIGVFTARPGMGKTYALRCFINGLNPNQYQTAYINLSTISVTEFYRQFCDLLGLEPSGNKTQMFKAIQERVYYLYKEKKQPLILAIDEAQYLN